MSIVFGTIPSHLRASLLQVQHTPEPAASAWIEPGPLSSAQSRRAWTLCNQLGSTSAEESGC